METIDKNAYKFLVTLALTTLSIGTVVFHFSEKLNWVDAYYFSVVTLSTVGYGDITPHTKFQKIFATFYIFIGVGILTTFISVTMKRSGQRMEKRRSAREEKKN